MGKFKTGAIKQYKEKIAFEEEQKRLKEQHNINKDCIVVEKNNSVKFIINLSIRLIKVIGTVTLLTLAVIGLISLIYPETRHPLTEVFQSIINQLTTFIK